MDGLQFPFVHKMKFDPSLRLGDENFAQKLKDGTRVERRSKEKRLDSVIGYPEPLDFALFATAVYQDRRKNESQSDYEKRLDLPKGWKLLTTATGLAFRGPIYGYFGAAYWQPARRRVVIAHRGTVGAFQGTKLKNPDAVRADLMAIVGNKYVKQMDAACTFAYKVRDAVEEVERERQTTFEIFFTGHSLGAWLAQVTTFSLKYVTLVKGAFMKNTVEGYHAHTVVFDSPGCEDTIRNMIKVLDVRYAGKSMHATSLDITSYLSSPNFINCCNTHVGKLFRVYPRITSGDYVSYTKSSHSMDAILQTFQTSLPIKEIINWPRIEIDLWRCKIREIWEIRENILGKEYRDFFQFAIDQSPYEPSAEDIKVVFELNDEKDENSKRFVSVQYQTKIARSNECAFNVFSHSELEFIQRFHQLKILPNSLFEGEEMSEQYQSKIVENLNNLIINLKEIRCEVRLIPYIKTLLRLYPDLNQRARNALTVFEVRKQIYIALTKEYQRKMQRLTNALLPSDWPDFTHFLDNEMSICHVLAQYGTDSAMAKVLKVIGTEENDVTVLAFELQNLVLIETFFHLTEFLKSDSWRDFIIVIESKAGTFKNEENIRVVQKLREDIQNGISNAKLILITDKKDEFDLDDSTVRAIHGGITWGELTDQARSEIISKKIITFQGNSEKHCLKNFVTNLSYFPDILDQETLLKFLKGVDVFVGPKLPALRDFYVPRKFKYNPYVKEEIFDNATEDDVLAVWASEGGSFSRITTKSEDGWKKRSNIRIITSDEDFKELLEKRPEKNIHCLKWKSNSLAWHKTKGSLNLIRRNIRDSVSETIWENIEDVAGKTLVISDAPGMGKSTVLDVLAQKLKERNPNHWVIRINLNDCAEAFNDALKNHTKLNDLLDVAEFLSSRILPRSENTNLRSEFERKLFENSLTSSGRIVLILDAFDEISPDYEMIVLRLVKILNESRLKKLVLSTRPHTKDQLEDELSVLSYTMVPFSRDDKKTFLKRFWERRLNDQRDLDKLAEQNVDQVEKSMGAENGDFLGNPLQCEMLAEYTLDRITVDENQPEWKNISLMELYENFVRRKMDIYYINLKTGGNVSVRNERVLVETLIRKAHRQYALRLLLSREKWHELEYPEIEEEVEEVREALEAAVRKAGLVVKTGDNPQFVHRTFAEFFVFDYILNLARNSNKNSNRKLTLLWREVLLQPEFVATRTFLDGLIRYEKNTHETTAILKRFARSVAQNRTDNETKCLTGLDYAVLHQLSQENTFFLLDALLETLTDVCGPKIVKSLIETPGPNSVFALHIASENGHLEIARLLLKNEANINACSDEGKTPLYLASENGHPEIVGLLLKNGANINARGNYGWTPLYVASKNGHPEIVHLLLENEADINARGNNGWTPLYVASKNGHPEIVHLLLENEADINARGNNGWTPLYVASKNGHPEIVHLLLENEADINARGNNGWTPLYVASKNGHPEIVHLLLKNGANINARGSYGWTPLYVASKNGHPEIVHLLLENEADINACTDEGKTPLHVASENGHPEIVRLLLENEADINACTDKGNTPLHVASENGHPEIVRLLLKNEADINARGNNGWTPVYVASKNGHPEIVHLLLENEADINACTDEGKTPLHVASENGHPEIVRLLLENEADINACTDEGNTPLHVASENGHPEIVRLLLKNEADINARGNNGWTPVYVASKNGHPEIVCLLLENEADINACTNEGTTPLHVASQNGHSEIVSLLVKRGTAGGIEHQPFAAECQLRTISISKFKGPNVKSKVIASLAEETETELLESIAGFKETYNRLETELQLANDRLDEMSKTTQNIEDSRIEEIHKVRERSLRLSMTKIELSALIEELENRVSESVEEESKFMAEATIQKDVYKTELIKLPMESESPTKDREKEERGTEVSEFEGSMVEFTNDGSELGKVSREHIAGFGKIYNILETELRLTNDRLKNDSQTELESERIHELRERSLQLSMTKIELTSLIAELEKRVSESESQN